MTRYSGKERRRFKRAKLKIGVIIACHRDGSTDVMIREGAREFKATMLDIGEGGISILTDIDIPILSTVWVRFTLSKTSGERTDFFGDMEEFLLNFSCEELIRRRKEYKNSVPF